jgi:predicted secreted Zn-dependent protease
MIRNVKIAVILLAVALTAAAGEENHESAGSARILSQRQDNIAPPLLNEKYEYYEVCGYCEKDVQRDLQKKCLTWKDGKRYDSVTNWQLKWDYDHNRAGQNCSPDSFRVTVNVTYHLPKWVPTGETPRQLVDKWDGYMKNLLVHEQGHRDIAVKAAAELTREVAQLPPALACADLDREIQELSRKQMRILDKKERQYDEATNHGYTQGAMFP